MSRDKSWHFVELERHLKSRGKDQPFDSSTVFLSNPNHRKQIDEIISNYLWPGVLKGLHGSNIKVKGHSRRYLDSEIKDKWYPHTTRTLTFVLEDPLRPLLPGSRSALWYCRGTIDCSMVNYLLSFDFIITLPHTFSTRKIIKLISNPLFAGLPPDLCCEESIDGIGYFVIEFSYGRGAGWLLEDFAMASQSIKEKIRLNLDIIDAVDELELDLTSTKKYNDLMSRLIEMYATF